jgi:hypothetical protein
MFKFLKIQFNKIFNFLKKPNFKKLSKKKQNKQKKRKKIELHLGGLARRYMQAGCMAPASRTANEWCKGAP